MTSTSPFAAGIAIESTGGHDDAAFVQGEEGALDGVDGREVERHGAAELGLGDDQDVMRHGAGLRWCGSPRVTAGR